VTEAGSTSKRRLAPARAVIFDLWETLVDWPRESWLETARALAARMGLAQAEFDKRWQDASRQRYLGTLAGTFAAMGAASDTIEDLVEIRCRQIRAALVPREGAVSTLQILRERGLKLGLISVCDEAVATAWPESEFGTLFDSVVFSCTVGLTKPDSRIYRECLRELAVEPAEALYVGDGGFDELAGAERVGMHPILICRAGEEPIWDSVRTWDRARITAIAEIIDHL
jgi:putative hydrolase of the HAD superfamily